jgi:hypothetical protein
LPARDRLGAHVRNLEVKHGSILLWRFINNLP